MVSNVLLRCPVQASLHEPDDRKALHEVFGGDLARVCRVRDTRLKRMRFAARIPQSTAPFSLDFLVLRKTLSKAQHNTVTTSYENHVAVVLPWILFRFLPLGRNLQGRKPDAAHSTTPVMPNSLAAIHAQVGTSASEGGFGAARLGGEPKRWPAAVPVPLDCSLPSPAVGGEGLLARFAQLPIKPLKPLSAKSRKRYKPPEPNQKPKPRKTLKSFNP